MKILVTGVTGQLGFDTVRALRRRGVEIIGATRAEMPLDDPVRTKSFVLETRPDAVIHCAAYTAVDRAEDEKELCRTVNVESTRAIAEACEGIDARLVYISTDYVFPGTGANFYETGDETAPCNTYGASKLAGENAVRDAMKSGRFFIVRTSWVFGVHGRNFYEVGTFFRCSDFMGVRRSRQEFYPDDSRPCEDAGRVDGGGRSDRLADLYGGFGGAAGRYGRKRKVRRLSRDE